MRRAQNNNTVRERKREREKEREREREREKENNRNRERGKATPEVDKNLDELWVQGGAGVLKKPRTLF